MRISNSVENFAVEASLTQIQYEIVDETTILIEGVPFNEYFATRELTAELLRGLTDLAKRLSKMGPAAAAKAEKNVAENLYPVFDAIVAFGGTAR
jgi:hypothetical protein